MVLQKNIGLTFVNYNYAFNTFYESYKELCLSLSDKNLVTDLSAVRKTISSFVYNYDYTIKDESQKNYYRNKLKEIKATIEADPVIKKITSVNLNYSILKNRLLHHRRYYYYFFEYLSVLGAFVKELTSTFMPNTNIQKKIIKFSNNQSFFEKFTEHKKIVLESLADFEIRSFVKAYNQLITFYYAYSLFISNSDSIVVENIFSNLISIYLNKDVLKLLSKDGLSSIESERLNSIEFFLHDNLLYINSTMNSSFSNYDVLPKIQKKIYTDKTLI